MSEGIGPGEQNQGSGLVDAAGQYWAAHQEVVTRAQRLVITKVRKPVIQVKRYGEAVGSLVQMTPGYAQLARQHPVDADTQQSVWTGNHDSGPFTDAVQKLSVGPHGLGTSELGTSRQIDHLAAHAQVVLVNSNIIPGNQGQ
jgi:hypothetical protein